MNKNFKVGQSNELMSAGRVYDLHNCYDFVSLTILGTREVRLAFHPNSSCDQGHAGLTVQAQSVEFFEASPRFGAATVEHIEEIGYKSRGDIDDSWLLTEAQASATDDLFFRFNDGHYVRFNCEQVLLIENAVDQTRIGG